MGSYYRSRKLNRKQELVSLEMAGRRLNLELRRFALRVLKKESQDNQELRNRLVSMLIGHDLPEV